MAAGAPYIQVRSRSDYWMYSRMFSTTCPVAVVDGVVAGAVIAFRGQDDPAEIYVQDVAIHPDFRRSGIARALLSRVHEHGVAWECERIFLTSEPENRAAHEAWTALGFVNVPGDRV